MLFAPAELNPYEWWIIKNLRAWAIRYRYSPEWYFALWIGEMEMFKHEGGMKAYERYRKLRDDMK